MSPVSFNRHQADALQAWLPELSFGSEPEAIGRDNPLLMAYLGFYHLDFSILFPDLCHGIGIVNAAGFRIATQYWIPPRARGTLLVVHGYYDHVGIYDKVISFGLEQGLAVLAFDLPGHGLSSGARATIDSFDQYGDVLEIILQRAQGHLPSPWYGMGQSTGGAVLLNHLWRYEWTRTRDHSQDPLLSKTALCAPLILPRAWGRGKIAYTLLYRFIRTLPRGRSRSSHDPDFVRFIDEMDCLQSKRLSVRWVGAMKQWDQQFCQFQPMDNALLVVQGDKDETVDWRYNLRQIQHKLPRANIAMIEGAGHQLVNERQDLREQVFTQINRFFFND